MIKKIYKCFVLAAAVVLALTSCAKVVAEDSDDYYDRVLKSWVKVHYPASVDKVSDYGVYVLEQQEGYGAIPLDSQYVRVNFTKYTLEGDIVASSYEKIGRQLREYKVSDYYGPNTWQIGIFALPIGLEETLTKMKEGGRTLIAQPMTVSSVLLTTYTDFLAEQEDDNYIYDIVLEEVIPDINKWQMDSLDRFQKHNYPGLDSLKKGFYVKKVLTLSDAEADFDGDGKRDTVADNNTMYVRYIGRRLDGTVFDTNIQDTAKKYGIYDSSNSYSTLSLTYKTDVDGMLSEASTVEGFTRAVHELNYGESVITFFWSDMGYKAAGSSTTIPEYSPLFFQIWAFKESDGEVMGN